ncbi:MAG: hypothetical protein ACI8XZ_004005, partial [Gammaproteobacteria bacterium]
MNKRISRRLADSQAVVQAISSRAGLMGASTQQGGEVSIDVSAVANDPRATNDKAQKIRRAALAPTNPSQQDKAVAARASSMAMQAKIEIQRAA